MTVDLGAILKRARRVAQEEALALVVTNGLASHKRGSFSDYLTAVEAKKSAEKYADRVRKYSWTGRLPETVAPLMHLQYAWLAYRRFCVVEGHPIPEWPPISEWLEARDERLGGAERRPGPEDKKLVITAQRGTLWPERVEIACAACLMLRCTVSTS